MSSFESEFILTQLETLATNLFMLSVFLDNYALQVDNIQTVGPDLLNDIEVLLYFLKNAVPEEDEQEQETAYSPATTAVRRAGLGLLANSAGAFLGEDLALVERELMSWVGKGVEEVAHHAFTKMEPLIDTFELKFGHITSKVPIESVAAVTNPYLNHVIEVAKHPHLKSANTVLKTIGAPLGVETTIPITNTVGTMAYTLQHVVNNMAKAKIQANVLGLPHHQHLSYMIRHGVSNSYKDPALQKEIYKALHKHVHKSVSKDTEHVVGHLLDDKVPVMFSSLSLTLCVVSFNTLNTLLANVRDPVREVVYEAYEPSSERALVIPKLDGTVERVQQVTNLYKTRFTLSFPDLL